MPDAGDIYYQAFSNAGQNIGNAIMEIQQRHKKMNEVRGTMDALQSMDDPQHPGKSLIPEKEKHAITEMLNRHSDRDMGALQAFTQIYGHLAQVGADARIKSEALASSVEPWFDSQTGKPLGYIKGGVPHPFPKYMVDPTPTKQEKLDEALEKPMAISHGHMEKSHFVEGRTKDQSPYVQVIGSDGVTRTYPKEAWKKKKAELKSRQQGEPSDDGDINAQIQRIRSTFQQKGGTPEARKEAEAQLRALPVKWDD